MNRKCSTCGAECRWVDDQWYCPECGDEFAADDPNPKENPMTLDRPTVTRLARDAQAALEAVAAEYGLTVEVNGGSYDPTVGTYKPKVLFKTPDSAKTEFEQWAMLYGLDAADYGREFTTQGRTFTISGVAPRSPKRPILADEGGRTFKFTADAVKRALAVAS